MIGEGEDTSQSAPPSHQRLTERIVGVTVHATVLSPPLSLRDSRCGGSDASYGGKSSGPVTNNIAIIQDNAVTEQFSAWETSGKSPVEEEICGTIECSGGWACGQHLQPQILGVMMASELKDHFGWGSSHRKSHANARTPGVFLTLLGILWTRHIMLSKTILFVFLFTISSGKKQKCLIFEFPCL